MQYSPGSMDAQIEERSSIQETTKTVKPPRHVKHEVQRNPVLSMIGWVEIVCGVIVVALSLICIFIVRYGVQLNEEYTPNATMGTPINYTQAYAPHGVWCGFIFAFCGVIAVCGGRRGTLCCCHTGLPLVHKVNMAFAIVTIFIALALSIISIISLRAVTYFSLSFIHGVQTFLGFLIMATCIFHAVYSSYYVRKYKREAKG